MENNTAEIHNHLEFVKKYQIRNVLNSHFLMITITNEARKKIIKLKKLQKRKLITDTHVEIILSFIIKANNA